MIGSPGNMSANPDLAQYKMSSDSYHGGSQGPSGYGANQGGSQGSSGSGGSSGQSGPYIKPSSDGGAETGYRHQITPQHELNGSLRVNPDGHATGMIGYTYRW